jgi:hypothetical protein
VIRKIGQTTQCVLLTQAASFDEAALHEVVETVGRRAGALLEIVNYNVDVWVSLPVTYAQLANFGFSRVHDTLRRATFWPCKRSRTLSIT